MAMRNRSFMDSKGRETQRQTHVINIKGNGFNIDGDMKNNFSVQLQSKWADLFNGLIPGAELLQKTGDASLTTGIFSRKYFQGGNALSITPEFRIYDDGSSHINLVTKTLKSLSNMSVADTLNKNSGEGAIQKTLNAYKQIQEVGGKFIKGQNVQLLNEAKELISNFTSANRTVSVKIGSFFECSSMIIENINFTSSREVTDTGPLYGDFTVGLLTMEALVRGTGTYGVDNIFLNGSDFQISRDGEDLED